MNTGIKFLAFLIIFGVLLGSCGITHFATKTTIEYKVDEKEAVGGQDGKYLIYTAENEVLENRDSMWELKWNSSDVYARLDSGKCYRSEAWGFRIPFLSMYRGIDQAKEIPCDTLQ